MRDIKELKYDVVSGFKKELKSGCAFFVYVYFKFFKALTFNFAYFKNYANTKSKICFKRKMNKETIFFDKR